MKYSIWHVIVIAVTSLLGLYLCATQFDETEIKAWSPMVLALLASWELNRRAERKSTRDAEQRP